MLENVSALTPLHFLYLAGVIVILAVITLIANYLGILVVYKDINPKISR